MGKDSAISWTHHTFSPWWGCQKVSPGCEHCYAKTLAERFGWRDEIATQSNPNPLGARFELWGPPKTTQRRLFGPQHWLEPLRWNAVAQESGIRHRVFCASMADVFEDHPQLAEPRGELFELIGRTPYLDWLLLTKRIENVRNMVPSAWLEQGFPENVWMGTSVEDQHYADLRIPYLLRLPARVRFLSCEPLLGPVQLGIGGQFYDYGVGERGRIDWVIVGGESGAQHRPMELQWARSLRDQCTAAGVAFHFKQWGGAYHDAGGRVLDGRTWDEFPS